MDNDQYARSFLVRGSAHELLGRLIEKLTVAEARLLCETVAARMPSNVAQCILRDALNRQRIESSASAHKEK